jgi:hypothetical protein
VGSLHFRSPSTIHPDELHITPFRLETKPVQSFDCGSKPLNDFLCSEEVQKYERLKLGRTYLVYKQGELAAYFTLSAGEIRAEYVRGSRVDHSRELITEKVPGLKVGRLAVDRRFQSQ